VAISPSPSAIPSPSPLLIDDEIATPRSESEVRNDDVTRNDDVSDVATFAEPFYIVWQNVSIAAGESVTLSYSFNAPDVSPEFYLLGPVKIMSSNTPDVSGTDSSGVELAPAPSPTPNTTPDEVP
jgi:hypothetical protein